METAGLNALDLHIAYYLGVLASADPAGFFHIISGDTGFDPLILHLKRRNIFSAPSESIEAMPCFRGPALSEVVGAVDKQANGLDELVKLAVDDLIKRKAAKPRKVSTLRSTVLARIGKGASSDVDAVVAALVRKGFVTMQGDKVAYHLPV